MKTKYKIYDSETGAHEYSVIAKQIDENLTKFKLKRGQNCNWTLPGETILKGLDDGNGVTIAGQHFDYADLHEMYVFITTMAKHFPNMFPILDSRKHSISRLQLVN